MIAVDTNILVRYAVKDDPQQTAVATDVEKKIHKKATALQIAHNITLLSSKQG